MTTATTSENMALFWSSGAMGGRGRKREAEDVDAEQEEIEEVPKVKKPKVKTEAPPPLSQLMLVPAIPDSG